MTLALTPGNAAVLADLAYIAYDSPDTKTFVEDARRKFPGDFTPAGPLIVGRTGVSKVAYSAVVFQRNRGGETENAVTIRGTQGGQDWLTNINIGMVPGPDGFPAHAGFYAAYASLRDEVNAQIGTAARRVHVCGHSLGGAQATLMAIDLMGRGHEVYLYTFGAPRVGSTSFALRLGRRLGEKRLFRTYDPGDPVPMIPLFPFVHAPALSDGYRSGGTRTSISTEFHSMVKEYLPSARKAANWEAMRKAHAEDRLAFGPAEWLAKAGAATRIPGSSTGLWALGKALESILKVIAGLVSTVFVAAMTPLDLMAYALYHGIRLGGIVSEWVMNWVRLALRWLGREVLAPAADLTMAFLRALLEMFLRGLANSARRALAFLDLFPRA